MYTKENLEKHMVKKQQHKIKEKNTRNYKILILG